VLATAEAAGAGVAAGVGAAASVGMKVEATDGWKELSIRMIVSSA
jgi:hypothetical protein